MSAERIKIPFSELDRVSDNRKMSFAPTGVSFSTADGKWQRVFDTAEMTEKNNIVLWHGKRVLVEGGVYQGLWLETPSRWAGICTPTDARRLLGTIRTSSST